MVSVSSKARELIANNPHLNELLQKGTISFVAKVLGAGLVFFLNVVISRLLGAEKVGFYFLGFSIISIMCVVSRLGFDRVITKLVSGYAATKDWDAIREVYRYVSRIVLSSSLSLSLLLLVCAPWLAKEVYSKPQLEIVLLIMAIAIVPRTLSYLYGHFFQGVKNMVDMQIAQNIGISLFVLLLIGITTVLNRSFDLIEMAWFFVISSAMLVVVLNYRWCSKMPVHIASKIVQIPKNDMWHMAFPLWSIAVLNLIMGSIALLLLGYWGSTSDVAILANATKTAMLVMLIPQAVNSIVGPKLGESFHRNDILAVKQTSVWATRLTIFFGVPVVMAMTIFPTNIMSLYGPDFVQGSAALVILSLGQFVYLATGPVTWILSMGKGERVLLVNQLSATVIMVVMCFWLIPKHGLVGAAVAHTCGLSAQMIFNSLAVWMLYGFLPLNIFSKTQA
jgi:O-antigen/teichoic acid export membrane protein